MQCETRNKRFKSGERKNENKFTFNECDCGKTGKMFFNEKCNKEEFSFVEYSFSLIIPFSSVFYRYSCGLMGFILISEFYSKAAGKVKCLLRT